MGVSGSQKFAVLLCKFSDTNTIEPYAPEFYGNLIANRGTGGLNDYWIAASQKAINLDGSQVFGWRTIQQKKADFLSAHPARWDKITGAIAAFPEVDTSKYEGVIAMYNVDVGDGGNAGNGVLASPTGMSVTFLGHETGHVFGLQHSFDQSTRKDADWSAPGEYFDMYDIMSAMNVYDTYDPQFQQRGPLLCAANLDRMGWLDPSRVWTAGTQSSWSDSFDLVSMSHPEIPGFIAAQVGPYYVEFRTQELWDAAIPRPGVLIHVMSDPNAVIIASDLSNYVDDWQPGQTFGPSDLQLAVSGGIQIRVISFDLHAKKARINARIGARRPVPSLGPAQLLGGVAVDGGGWLILNGRIVPIPPRSPVMSLAEAIASYVTAEANLSGLAAGLNMSRSFGG